MANKEVLEHLENAYDSAYYPMSEFFSESELDTIKQAFNQVEKLEKENQELKAKGKELLNDFNKTLEIAKEYKRVIEIYKRVIEILKEEPYILEFGLENFAYDKVDNTYYYEEEKQCYDIDGDLCFKNEIYVISKEKYDLLKGVLEE